MDPTKKSSSTKAPAKKPKHVVAPPPKSQYELERDARNKRNEEYMLSLGINPYGGGYMKQNKKAPPKPRAPKRLTYDWSYDEGPKRRSLSSRRKRVRAVDELTDEQRAVLEGFNMDDFEAYERRRPL